ncbi:unnamed protein product [Phytophthora fragariaefolia]|uniref:Unnamed protein product n=1 Tax=Phytophthora fragariaefolia TaxID=1490495 RepID=A0A9W7D295_9STRA|nr:unnamed protein product [Phytophthora fragariaefolia]
MLTTAEGIPAQCTRNASSALHLANGTIGNITGFKNAANDRIQVVQQENMNVHVHSKPPDAICIQLRDHQLRKKRLLTHFPLELSRFVSIEIEVSASN